MLTEKQRRVIAKCLHGRERSKCKECGGSQICEHGRVRSTCKECGGSQICEHGRRRSICKECNTPERYKKTNAQRRAAEHKRMAHIYYNGGSGTAAEFTAMCAQYDHRCACCGKKCKSLHADHILAASKGGKTIIGNLQPLCLSCNTSKKAKTGAYTCICGRHHENASVRMKFLRRRS